MGETNKIQIQIPTCSSNYQISKDIYSFLHKQGNHIPISLNLHKKQSGGFLSNLFNVNANSEINPEKKETHSPQQKQEQANDDESNIYLHFQNKTHNIDNIKGTKLYYLYLRNGECARWV